MPLRIVSPFFESEGRAPGTASVRTPLVLVSAYDDPAVERTMFEELMLTARGNPWIAAYETDDGGHFGFDVAYGKDYIHRIIRLMLDSQVLRTWNG